LGSAERDEIIRRLNGKFSDFYRKQRGRNEHKTWTFEEEQKIIDFFKKETPIENIAKEMERTPAAIVMRLEKLGFKADI
jgi:predicted DNA binding CopG/RHH family protein